MLTLLMFAPIVTAAPPPQPAPVPMSAARRVIEQQLAVPPRTGPAAGLNAEEADAVAARNIALIGQKLTTEDRTKIQ